MRHVPAETLAVPRHPSLREAVWVWVRVALLSFGGPAGQIATMHRILVEEKAWISDARFLHALNYCMLLPGPEAQQLATYIGWLLHRTRGGVIAGGLFVFPGIVTLMVLSAIYAAYGRVAVVSALFFGLKAAVLAVVLEAVVKVARKALKNWLMLTIAAVAFVAIFFVGVPFPFVVIGAAAVGFIGGRSGSRLFEIGGGHAGAKADAAGRTYLISDDSAIQTTSRTEWYWTMAICLALWLVPVLLVVALLGRADTFSHIALFFSKMAVVTFGGAYAVLAYVAQQAVDTYGWLGPGEMLDGLGMAETTPGPLIMVLQYVGFLAGYRAPHDLPPMLAGTLGGLLATWVTFVPCFLWILVGAPYIEVLRGNKALTGALSAITAAVVGVILNLAVWFAIHTLFATTRHVEASGLSFDAPVWNSLNAWSLAISIGSIFALFWLRIGMITTIAAASACGMALFALG